VVTTTKHRLIQDHSFPRNSPSTRSVNDEIDSSLFTCDWGSFLDCLTGVLDAPQGTEVAVFDVEAAHRRMPTAPEDRLHVCIQWKGKVIMDHCCCFGCSSSSGIFGRVADAFKAILLAKGVDRILKWADDFTFWRIPSPPSPRGPWSYRFGEALIWDVASELGWPWSPTKCKPFSSAFRYIGFDWDLANKTVSLPESKRLKFRAKLQGLLSNPTIDRKACLSLVGSLNHCAVVVAMSRAHLPSFYRLASRFNNSSSDFIKLRPSREALDDAAWWMEMLSKDWCGIRIKPRPPRHPEAFFVDASTGWGIGLVFRDRWLAWPLKAGWEGEGKTIGWAEFVALELAVLTAANAGLRDVSIPVHSDNQGVVGAFSSGYSRSPAQNAVLRRILLILHEFNLGLDLAWIPSAQNPADGPSRGRFPAWSRLLSCPPRIPFILRPLVGNAIVAPPRLVAHV
jgi:hypothetical protein